MPTPPAPAPSPAEWEIHAGAPMTCCAAARRWSFSPRAGSPWRRSTSGSRWSSCTSPAPPAYPLIREPYVRFASTSEELRAAVADATLDAQDDDCREELAGWARQWASPTGKEAGERVVALVDQAIAAGPRAPSGTSCDARRGPPDRGGRWALPTDDRPVAIVPVRRDSTRLPEAAAGPGGQVPGSPRLGDGRGHRAVRGGGGGHRLPRDRQRGEGVRRRGGDDAGRPQSGTDRVAEAAARRARGRVVVNVQGDQPWVTAASIEALLGALQSDAQAPMATAGSAIR